jgi:hypothetical protein
LKIRVAHDFANREALLAELDAACPEKSLLGIESVRAGAAIERSYEVELGGEAAADQLIARLSAIDGVLSVEVVRASK